MAKQSLLVADADPRSLRILDVALRKAGFQVSTASDGAEALRRIQRNPPDLILADVSLPGTDGVALCRAVRADARLAPTPVILISSSKEAALKLSAHEAGADDFLGKPLLIKELTTRIKMLLTRREQQELSRDSQSAVTGDIGEMGLVDLIQSLDSNNRSALISCDASERSGQIWIREGQVIDAEAGALSGEAAFYRVLGWETGKFSAQFTGVSREARITQPTQALLAESVRRVDELERLSAQLPLSTILSIDFPALNRRLADLPDEVNGVIRLCDGIRTIEQVMERAPIDELSVLAVLERLIAERVLLRVEPPAARLKPSLHAWLGPNSVATPAPPIMGAHGRPQSGDPTPIAPPVSDPPIATQPSMARAPRAEQPGAASVESQNTPSEPVRVFDTPADPVPAHLFTASAGPVAVTPAQAQPALDELSASPSPSITPPQGTMLPSLEITDPVLPSPSSVITPSDPLSLQLLAPPLISAQPSRTDVFMLPEVRKAPVPVVQFSPMRGVRRERLRHEADEARTRVSEGRAVRLTHVVELPSWPAGSAALRRRISPAVGEAAKKFAPDALGSPETDARGEATHAPVLEPAMLLPLQEDELESPLAEQSAANTDSAANAESAANDEVPLKPIEDDRDLYADSATMQVEPLSSEALAGAAPQDSLVTPPRAESVSPAVEAAAPSSAASASDASPAAATPASETEKPEKSAWEEATDPNVEAPFPPAAAAAENASAPAPGASHEATTSPGHRIGSGEAITEPVPAMQEPAPTSTPAEAFPILAPARSDAPPAAAANFSSEAISAEISRIQGSAARAKDATSELKPVKPAAPVVASSDADFEAEMRAALGKNRKRWPIYVGVAAVIIALIVVFRPQPATDKGDSPWLGKPGEDTAAATPTPAVVPPVVPAPAAADAGPAQAANPDAGAALDVDAGALAAAVSPTQAAPDAGFAAQAATALAAPAVPAPPVVPPPVANPPSGDEYAHALAAGEALLKRGKYRSAVGELKKAVALNPESVPALLELGDAYLESDQPRSALKPLDRAAKLDSRSSRAQLLLGTALQSLGKNTDAIHSYQRYLEMDPSGEYAHDVRSILANLQK